MKIASLSGVSKQYRTSSQVISALNNVSLDIESSEFIALAGPSGSGKTTLANILGFLDNANSGTYVYHGKDVTQKNTNDRTLIRRNDIGFVFQSFNLVEVLTAQENVSLSLEISGLNTADAMKRSLEMLDNVGIADMAKRFPNELSGGQQQRVAIARALVKKPSMVIADEPSANLDSENTAMLISLLLDLNTQLRTVCIVCTHDERVLKKAPRVIYLKDGAVERDIRR